MKKTLYVILEDINEDLGDGCYSSSYDTFLGVVNDFDTARNIIEYMVDFDIGEENPDYKYCDGCEKGGFCGECQYYKEAEVVYEDWSEIRIREIRAFGFRIYYHFRKIEVNL